MFETFSREARMILFFARYRANQLKSERIEASHILFGFILEDQGMTDLQLLRALGIGMEDAGGSGSTWSMTPQKTDEPFLDRATAEKLQPVFSSFDAHSGSQAGPVDMHLTKEAQGVLIKAFEHADGSTVSPLHLLWAVLSDETGSVSDSLKKSGITRESIDAEIRKRYHP